jgi:opacity protein-like surface antigen
MKIAVYSLVFLCCAAGAGAQDQDFTSIRRQPYVQLNYHSGTFWSRTEYLQEAFEDPYRAVEFRLGLQSTGKRLWEQIHMYPKYGVGVHYSDLIMNPADTTIGNPFSLFLFYSAPWARWGKFTLAADLSTGLSYMDRIHHPVHNPFNDVVASHINLYLDLKVNLGYSLSQRMDLYAGYGLTHYSNGRIHQPQKGVNNWGWTAGVSYLFQDRMENFIHRQTPEFHASESIEFMLAVGVVEEIPMGTEIQISYFTSSFTADYVYQFNPKMAVTLGMDLLYDASLGMGIKGIAPDEVTTWQKTYLASHMGYHYILNRFRFLFNLGTYFRQHSYDRGFFFFRAGGRLQITEHLSGHLCIKSKQGIRSDWIEWGAAYSFKIR